MNPAQPRLPYRKPTIEDVRALMLAGALWYGLSRASAPGSKYVPARIDGTEITPGHMEPRR